MILKQCVGIDISKNSFTACTSKFTDDTSIKSGLVRTFSNNRAGFKNLSKWVKTQTDNSFPLIYCMEATGTYYEALAHYLYLQNDDVRLLSSLKNDKTVISNRLDAANCGYEPDKMMMKTYNDLIKTIDKKIGQVEKHIKDLN